MNDILGYATVPNIETFKNNYNKFIENHKGQNIWYDYKLTEWMNNNKWLKDKFKVDIFELYEYQYKSALLTNNSGFYNYDNSRFSQLIDFVEYQKEFGQRFTLLAEADNFIVIKFGKYSFLIFNKDDVKIEYLKDYSGVTINQLRGSVAANKNINSVTSLVPSSLSDQTIDSTASAINDKKAQIEKLKSDMDDIKNCKSKELAVMKEEIDRKVAELEDKKQKMMQVLEAKKAEMKEMMQQLENQLFVLETEIYAIRCFLGEVVEFTKLRSGKFTSEDTPIILFQKIKYLDEELGKLISLYNVDFEDVKTFEKYLKVSDFALEQFCPSQKCISLVRVSKNNRKLGLHSDIINMVEAYEKYHGKTIGILVRDGENVFIGWTDDEYINIQEDMFYRPEVKTYYDSEDAKSEPQTTKEEIASRYCVFSILQGLLENDADIIRLKGKHNFVKPDDMIIYSTADNWIVDNRFGTLSSLVDKYSDNINIKCGDEIISLQSLRPNNGSTMWGYTKNDRGIGYANRTHDVRLEDAKVIRINKIIIEHSWYILYNDPESPFYNKDKPTYYKNEIYVKDDTIGVTDEQIKNWVTKNPGKEFIEVEHKKHYSYYVSLEKDLRWDKDESDYKILPRANFEVYPGEFINLVFFNSIWLEYVITNKAIGNGLKLGRFNVSYADIIKHLKYALDAVRKREAEESKIINNYINLDDYPEWQLKLSEFKYTNDIHKIGPRAAKKFADYLINTK